MPNLAKQAELVADDEFRVRVQAAAVQAAVNISGEDTDPTHAKAVVRQRFATAILQGETNVEALAWAVSANSTILGEYVGGGTSAIPDGDIEFVVTSIWDDVSGAAPIPLPVDPEV